MLKKKEFKKRVRDTDRMVIGVVAAPIADRTELGAVHGTASSAAQSCRMVIGICHATDSLKKKISAPIDARNTIESGPLARMDGPGGGGIKSSQIKIQIQYIYSRKINKW